MRGCNLVSVRMEMKQMHSSLPVAPLKTQASSVGTTELHAPRYTAIGVHSVFCWACSANGV